MGQKKCRKSRNNKSPKAQKKYKNTKENRQNHGLMSTHEFNNKQELFAEFTKKMFFCDEFSKKFLFQNLTFLLNFPQKCFGILKKMQHST